MPETITEKQLEANRRNAQLSTGPKTPEGKNKVKWNALKHGLLAKAVILPKSDMCENRAEFESLLRQLRKELKPVGILEEMLTEKIAVGYWRLRRAVKAEAGEITKGLLHWDQLPCQPRYLKEDRYKWDLPKSSRMLPSSAASDKIVRYETAIERRIHKAIEQLQHLQKRRRRKPRFK
ncbi:MAG: hypothetical protein AB1744_08635, partial [Candidatus Zixiibacteriota bacterium]